MYIKDTALLLSGTPTEEMIIEDDLFSDFHAYVVDLEPKKLWPVFFFFKKTYVAKREKRIK